MIDLGSKDGRNERNRLIISHSLYAKLRGGGGGRSGEAGPHIRGRDPTRAWRAHPLRESRGRPPAAAGAAAAAAVGMHRN